MNIFYLDDNITLCAQYHCDSHVVKMILESTQILCTVLHKCGQDAPYKATHENHPCVLWAYESLDNWLWLQKLIIELDKEFKFRFNHTKSHRSCIIAKNLSLPAIKSLGITERPQTMKDEYKVKGNPVTAYRKFYVNEKSHILKYTKRDKPSWLENIDLLI